MVSLGTTVQREGTRQAPSYETGPKEGGRQRRKAGKAGLLSPSLGEVTKYVGSFWNSALLTFSWNKHPVPFRTCPGPYLIHRCPYRFPSPHCLV